ncbi:related to nucleoporin [Phialocephala subalpina]|uniref:Related to nucleoporin n=1 Tax=Phialocephala subalpina TaxID=576137 RepID=A0A1L7XB92_9HELO|nr:related to nucleoporin [Phialocephala subalpina]
MASTAAADAILSERSNHENKMDHEQDVTESTNHDLPARTLGEDERPEHAQKEDPATVAASEELKHTTISDKIATVSRVQPPDVQTDIASEDKDMGDSARATTPETHPNDALDEEMKERLASPKKKRGRDLDDDGKDLEDDTVDDPGSSADGSVVNGSRTTRLEPEKKRPRDTSKDTPKPTETAAEAKVETAPADSAKPEYTKSEDKTSSPSGQESTSEASSKLQTSSSAFASSGFASLATTSSSPFGSLGASKPSVFGVNTQSAPSGFGALAAKPAETSTTISGFGALGAKPATGFGFGSGATSGFGGLASGSVFGSKLGNGFAGGAGPKLSSFAAPGKDKEIIGAKPAKAFGAPESDEEAESDDSDDSEGGAAEDEESSRTEADDKKKAKLTKVHIDDGESGEATLLQLRARIFAMENKEKGWVERGVGTLKLNVPRSCASFDENGVALSGSFDISGLDDEEADEEGPKVPRLIMRQENTHRVILNTIIVKAMAFTDKQPASSSAQILFTAFEGEKEPKPVSILLKACLSSKTVILLLIVF